MGDSEEHFSSEPDVRLSDGVVALRPMDLNDLETHLAGEDPEQVRWLSGGVSTRESVTSWIERNQEHWRRGGPIFNFGIEEVGSRQLVGIVEANTNSDDVEGIRAGEANVAYGLYRAARGKGYASRAVLLLIEFLASRKISAAVIRVDPENERSMLVPARCGFERSGTLQTKDEKTLVVFRKLLREPEEPPDQGGGSSRPRAPGRFAI